MHRLQEIAQIVPKVGILRLRRPLFRRATDPSDSWKQLVRARLTGLEDATTRLVKSILSQVALSPGPLTRATSLNLV